MNWEKIGISKDSIHIGKSPMISFGKKECFPTIPLKNAMDMSFSLSVLFPMFFLHCFQRYIPKLQFVLKSYRIWSFIAFYSYVFLTLLLCLFSYFSIVLCSTTFVPKGGFNGLYGLQLACYTSLACAYRIWGTQVQAAF